MEPGPPRGLVPVSLGGDIRRILPAHPTAPPRQVPMTSMTSPGHRRSQPRYPGDAGYGHAWPHGASPQGGAPYEAGHHAAGPLGAGPPGAGRAGGGPRDAAPGDTGYLGAPSYGAVGYAGDDLYPGAAGLPGGVDQAVGAGRWAAAAEGRPAPAGNPSAPAGHPVPVPAPEHGGTGMISNWPLQDSLELGALPDAVPCGRLHTRQIIWEWGLDWLGEGAELVLSELLTNAVNAARSGGSIGPVRLWLLADRTQLLILVWDANPLPPVRVFTSEETEGGRGLMLVDTLARRWDWYVPLDIGGKVVWALL